MKLCIRKIRDEALTLFEVLVVVSIVIVGAALFVTSLAEQQKKEARLACLNHLKQIGLAYRVWEGDNDDKFPAFVSVTNGGIMEWTNCGPQIVISNFLVMSNEISIPKILACPQDTNVVAVNAFSQLTISNISYFMNRDASDDQPQELLSGDDHLRVNGSPVPPGDLMLPTNAVITWSTNRHNGSGNLGFADGSAREVRGSGLTVEFSSAGAFTNRIVIP